MTLLPTRTPEWFTPITPRDAQWEIYEATCEHIKSANGTEPAYVYASVAAGKTIMMAMIAKRAQQVARDTGRQQLRILCLARTGELVEQNAEEMWNMSVNNSIFSASVGRKSTSYPVVVGSEGTVARALDKEFNPKCNVCKGFGCDKCRGTGRTPIVFDVLLIDECHQVNIDDESTQYMAIINEMVRRNPKLRIIGYTGSPWRGTEPIKGKFWKHELYRLSMWDMVKLGDVCPPVFGFGHDDVQYDLSSITPSGEDGTDDFSADELKQQQKIILESGTTTQKIMLEVMELTKSRNCVLITCAGSKHIKECAAVLPEGTYATITEKTTYKDRKAIKEGCNNGTIKYVLQIGCWTVGVNIPPIDTIVILRRIGSLTLLTQLVGRGIRKLKQEHRDAGMRKDDCLCLDYAGTFESLSEFFDDELIEAAQFEKSKRKQEFIYCPRCNTENSSFARRCRNREHGTLEKDGRCGFFWSSKVCLKCGTENDKVARSCRECDHILVDPNAKLTGKHYTETDKKPVLKFEMFLTQCGNGIVVQYHLPDDELAKEVFWPKSENINAKRMWYAWLKQHLHQSWHSKILYRSAATVISQKAIFDIPTHITHRINEKGLSVIRHKSFLSGRIEQSDIK